MAFEELTQRLAEALQCDVDDVFSPAEEDDLDSLVHLGMPSSVIDFYRENAPIDTLEFGDIRLWPVPQLLEENQSYPPGAEVHDLGYIVVAGHKDGGAYCLDLGPTGDEDPPTVAKIPHDIQVGSRDRVQVEKQAESAADSFEDFLDALSRQVT